MNPNNWEEPLQHAHPVISQRFDPLIDAAVTPFRLGVFGGTFDPVHIGHLHIAERAREQFALDGILFIPSGIPPWKDRSEVSSAKDRHAMLLVAVAGNQQFDVSRLEMQREGVSYTIDTLRAIKQRYEDRVELFLIVGADVVADINSWKEAKEVAALVTLICARREIVKGSETVGVNKEEELIQLAADGGFTLCWIDSALVGISSSELRQWIAEGRSVHYLIPDATCSYIREQGLYQRQG
ncbi:MAG: nicotinate-nucleotide adenylyltransferase [Coriobacteriia bacterium]|nr:nicotinate-nucleotide adenylyltransferase [Coriobacteriia bacterium]